MGGGTCVVYGKGWERERERELGLEERCGGIDRRGGSGIAWTCFLGRDGSVRCWGTLMDRWLGQVCSYGKEYRGMDV